MGIGNEQSDLHDVVPAHGAGVACSSGGVHPLLRRVVAGGQEVRRRSGGQEVRRSSGGREGRGCGSEICAGEDSSR